MGKDDSEKNSKRAAQALRDEAVSAFEQGDYQMTRVLNARIVALAPDSEPGRKAAQVLQQLRIEPLGLYLGAGALALYLATWVFSLW